MAQFCSDNFACQLKPVQPVVAAFQLCPEKGQIVAGIDRKPSEEKDRIFCGGSADSSAYAIFITAGCQRVGEVLRQSQILFWEGKWIRKRIDRRAYFTFYGLLGVLNLKTEIISVCTFELQMACGMRTERDALLV